MVSVQVIATPAEFDLAVSRLEAGSGPIAIDAERASGFTYSQRAYLIQVFRREAGIFLFDPPAIGDMSRLSDAGKDVEWILHAASQDLACLREVGIDPQRIFDTELSARLLGFERVGLGSVVAEVLDVHLAKEHSAADWSTRPLPEPWLEYAVQDVELLVDLRDKLHAQLLEQQKWEIAQQEFSATLEKKPKEISPEPWRKLSGMHTLRAPRQLAIARALWLARDEYAQRTDTSPGRLLPDASIIAAVMANVPTKTELAKLKSFNGRASRAQLDRWWQAIEEGRRDEHLPIMRVPSEGPPPHRTWREKNPEALARLRSARAVLEETSQHMNLPLENLLTPATLREIAWQPPEELSTESIAHELHRRGARQWQIDATAAGIAEAFLHPSEQTDDDRTEAP